MDFLIPTTIDTARLTLRMFKEEDWRDLHAYYSDIACMKYTIGKALTAGETWRTMAGMIGHWQLRGFGPYALEVKETQKVIGTCGLWFPNDWPEPEIKWGLVRDQWGKGYVTEAARAVKKMAYQRLQKCNLISLIIKENENSIRVAEALGATKEKEIVFRDKGCYIYRHAKG